MTESEDSEFKTYSLEEVVAMIDPGMKEPVRWLTRQIKVGRVTARKMGRSWRMTRADIQGLLEGARNEEPPTVVELDNPALHKGLTKLSRARRGML